MQIHVAFRSEELALFDLWVILFVWYGNEVVKYMYLTCLAAAWSISGYRDVCSGFEINNLLIVQIWHLALLLLHSRQEGASAWKVLARNHSAVENILWFFPVYWRSSCPTALSHMECVSGLCQSYLCRVFVWNRCFSQSLPSSFQAVFSSAVWRGKWPCPSLAKPSMVTRAAQLATFWLGSDLFCPV